MTEDIEEHNIAEYVKQHHLNIISNYLKYTVKIDDFKHKLISDDNPNISYSAYSIADDIMVFVNKYKNSIMNDYKIFLIIEDDLGCTFHYKYNKNKNKLRITDMETYGRRTINNVNIIHKYKNFKSSKCLNKLFYLIKDDDFLTKKEYNKNNKLVVRKMVHKESNYYTYYTKLYYTNYNIYIIGSNERHTLNFGKRFNTKQFNHSIIRYRFILYLFI